MIFRVPVGHQFLLLDGTDAPGSLRRILSANSRRALHKNARTSSTASTLHFSARDEATASALTTSHWSRMIAIRHELAFATKIASDAILSAVSGGCDMRRATLKRFYSSSVRGLRPVRLPKHCVSSEDALQSRCPVHSGKEGRRDDHEALLRRLPGVKSKPFVHVSAGGCMLPYPLEELLWTSLVGVITTFLCLLVVIVWLARAHSRA